MDGVSRGVKQSPFCSPSEVCVRDGDGGDEWVFVGMVCERAAVALRRHLSSLSIRGDTGGVGTEIFFFFFFSEHNR